MKGEIDLRLVPEGFQINPDQFWLFTILGKNVPTLEEIRQTMQRIYGG